MKIQFNERLNINGRDLECHLSIENGRVYQLKGENGIGKTTFFSFLKANQKEFFKTEKTVFVDQIPLLPLNSVSFEDLKKILKKDRVEKLEAFNILELMISNFSHQSIKSLSGGQNQLVKIAISLFLGGDIFFFDEPLNHLDKEKEAKVSELLIQLKVAGKTLFIIDHQKEWETGFIDKTFTMTSSDIIRLSDGI